METRNKDQERETASATLVSGMHFIGAIDDFRMDLDAEKSAGGVSAGPQPHRLLLQALAGCTAMDVISILRKKRQQVSSRTGISEDVSLKAFRSRVGPTTGRRSASPILANQFSKKEV